MLEFFYFSIVFIVGTKSSTHDLKPFYKFSNNYVHSGTKSLMFNIGTINGLFPDDTLTASSNIGFTDPAQLCLLSMFNSTLAFLSLNSGMTPKK